MLEGRDDLKNSEKAFSPYQNQSGALFRITVKKCNIYPDLDNQSFGAFLEYDSMHPTKGPQWNLIDLDPSKCQNKIVADDDQIPAEWLPRSDEERKILSYIRKNKEVTRRDIQTLLKSCSPSKAGQRLKKLREDGFVVMPVKSKNSTYILAAAHEQLS